METQGSKISTTAPKNEQPLSMTEKITSKAEKDSHLGANCEDQSHNSPGPVVEEENEGEHVTGIQLAVIVSAVTLIAFLFMLDVSIISTVSSTFHQMARLAY